MLLEVGIGGVIHMSGKTEDLYFKPGMILEELLINKNLVLKKLKCMYYIYYTNFLCYFVFFISPISIKIQNNSHPNFLYLAFGEGRWNEILW